MEVNEEFKKLTKYYHEQKLAHAYLLETNNQEKCLKDLIEFLKELFCLDNYEDNCQKCNLCSLLTKQEFPNLVIIRPDGKNIKKEQVKQIQERMSYKPNLSKINAYVIMESEKLNGASANTMLKFIEEPFDDCFGFFITNNKENMLLTIQSRCECLKVNYENSKEIDEEFRNTYLPMIKEYLSKIEVEKKYSIMYNKILLQDKLIKDNIEKVFKEILVIYKSYFYAKIDIESSDVINSDFAFIANNSVKSLEKKIGLITKVLNNINYNLNLELMLDKFVIEMGEING